MTVFARKAVLSLGELDRMRLCQALGLLAQVLRGRMIRQKPAGRSRRGHGHTLSLSPGVRIDGREKVA
jgi:hypothetical protein